MKNLLLCVLVGLASLASYAEVTMDSVFTSYMVLQREQPIVFFGKATPGAELIVRFNEVEQTVFADGEGAWRAEYPAMKASSQSYELSVVGEGRSIVLRDLLIGDVWFCSGQSNMEMPMGTKSGWRIKDFEKEAAEANYPEIRIAYQPRRYEPFAPREDVSYVFREVDMMPREEKNRMSPAKVASTSKGSWVKCCPEVAPLVSAAAYFFARKLHQDLQIPIGLVLAAKGGAKIEPWISREGFVAAGLESDLKAIHALDEQIANRDALTKEGLEKNKKLLADWKAKVDAEQEPGKKAELQKARPKMVGLPWNNDQCYSALYNGMAAGWTKLPIKGVIWYQGCANTNGSLHYYALNKALIADWRAKWKNPTLPFLMVQLAGYRGPKDWKTAPYQANTYALLREIQGQIAWEDPNVGLATAMDVGENFNIHPENKQAVGMRLALEAERIVYGMDIVSRGPVFESATVEGQAIRVRFKHAAGLKTSDGQAPNGFCIAGEDKNFIWADAVIEGETVKVSSPDVPSPQYVRYGYTAYRGDYNLQNSANLPAFPFRSDSIDYSKVK